MGSETASIIFSLLSAAVAIGVSAVIWFQMKAEAETRKELELEEKKFSESLFKGDSRRDDDK